MLKVLHLIYYPGKGGVEKYVQTLIQRMHNKKCEIFLGYVRDLGEDQGPLIEEAKKSGVQIYQFPMKSPYDFKAALNVKNFCREHEIDVIHTHFIRENYISILSKIFGNKVKLIYTSHVIFEKSPLLKLSNIILFSRLDNIIAVCDEGKKQLLKEKHNKNKIVVIHNGVDTKYWENQNQSTLREEFGLSKNSFLFVTVGRFTREKGQKFLVEAIGDLKNNTSSDFMQKIKFAFVGDGEEFEECKKSARDLNVEDCIVFLGFRNDIKNILHGCDAYISPSEKEALSISIIEALASGLPVIATDVGGTKEVVNEKNDCGILVKYGDKKELADRIQEMAQNKELYNRLKNNAFKTVNEKFSLDKTVDSTYNLYVIDFA